MVRLIDCPDEEIIYSLEGQTFEPLEGYSHKVGVRDGNDGHLIGWGDISELTFWKYNSIEDYLKDNNRNG